MARKKYNAQSAKNRINEKALSKSGRHAINEATGSKGLKHAINQKTGSISGKKAINKKAGSQGLKKSINKKAGSTSGISKINSIIYGGTSKENLINRQNLVTESRVRSGLEFESRAQQSEFYAATVDLWLGIQGEESRNKAIVKGLQDRGINVETLKDAIDYVKTLLQEEIDTLDLEEPADGGEDRYNTAAAAAVAARL